MSLIYDEAHSGYWTIETPFSEDDQYEYEVYEQPVIIDMHGAMYGTDPVQQRMMVVLAMVALGIILFAGLAIPRLQSAPHKSTT